LYFNAILGTKSQEYSIFLIFKKVKKGKTGNPANAPTYKCRRHGTYSAIANRLGDAFPKSGKIFTQSRKDAKKRIVVAGESLQNKTNATPMCCEAAQSRARMRMRARIRAVFQFMSSFSTPLPFLQTWAGAGDKQSENESESED